MPRPYCAMVYTQSVRRCQFFGLGRTREKETRKFLYSPLRTFGSPALQLPPPWGGRDRSGFMIQQTATHMNRCGLRAAAMLPCRAKRGKSRLRRVRSERSADCGKSCGYSAPGFIPGRVLLCPEDDFVNHLALLSGGGDGDVAGAFFHPEVLHLAAAGV